MTEAGFRAIALGNPVNAALLDRFAGLGLPQAHLTAGCLFQAVWNHQAGRDPAWGIRDDDVFYSDAGRRAGNSHDLNGSLRALGSGAATVAPRATLLAIDQGRCYLDDPSRLARHPWR